ncbi:helix-turn-helix transcriptional regulator [Oscillibacter sp.]|uniref:helix-turn-helix domain-containing protein n=1 Tax=Oscillibacter sp. TaxID=1945593 RepID=UPI003395BEF3
MKKNNVRGEAEANDKREVEAQRKKLQCDMGDMLRKLREVRNLTQNQAAEYFYPLVNDYSSWSRYENGDRPIPHLLIVAVYRKWNVLIYPLDISIGVPKEIQEHVRALAEYFNL